MRTQLQLIALLLAASAPVAAQRGNIDHRYSVFLDGPTAPDPAGSFFNNIGAGGSLEARMLANVSLRFMASYDRVSTGGSASPNQYVNGALVGVFYPIPESRVRPYAFGGLGYTRQAEHVDVLVKNGITTTSLRTANYYMGLDAGFGLELGELFIQFRVPPRPRVATATSDRYNLISLGLRF